MAEQPAKVGRGICDLAARGRLCKATERFEAAVRERSDAAEELLRAQVALRDAGEDDASPAGCVLDDAAAEIAYHREAFCNALWQRQCAERLVQHTSTVFRKAMRRLDALALREALTEKG